MHVFSDAIKKSDTTLKLFKIDPLNKNIHKPSDALDVGLGVNLHFINLQEKRKIQRRSCSKFSQRDNLIAVKYHCSYTTQKMKFIIKDFFCKCNKIRRKLLI